MAQFALASAAVSDRIPAATLADRLMANRLVEDGVVTERVARFFADEMPATPCVIVDLDVVERNYRLLAQSLPDTRIFYAIKANPAPEVLEVLASLGSNFDCASVEEIQMALAAGATPDRISYGNTIKKERDIARAYRLGIRLFAFDAAQELEKLARQAPGARVFCRILTSGAGAEWPLSRKFGCEPAMAEGLLLQARRLGLEPFGVSFHVGSQQRDTGAWDEALATSAQLFRNLEAKGVELKMVNLGGGLPSRYRTDVPTAQAYGQAIKAALVRHFGNRLPETIVEPGRSMVGDAGTIFSEVVLVSKKSAADEKRWVFLDIGKFHGLAETMDEAIQYPIAALDEGESAPVVLAGPTCDSADVLYERADYRLPLALTAGDLLLIGATGAYTTTYSSIGFNGFAPLASYCI